MKYVTCGRCGGNGWVYPPGEDSEVIRCGRCRGSGQVPRRWKPPRDPKRLAARDEE